ncbi:MAG: hypothetical protein VCG02_03265, partial [Verrucomicrobiota bacterium]
TPVGQLFAPGPFTVALKMKFSKGTIIKLDGLLSDHCRASRRNRRARLPGRVQRLLVRVVSGTDTGATTLFTYE